ncbi:MAG: hypothetical protein VKP57_00920 [Candidatus Sericytochromatia bacterium]|nr:hypothetical protein [Candidatus Sericytochromatia bacterium]
MRDQRQGSRPPSGRGLPLLLSWLIVTASWPVLPAGAQASAATDPDADFPSAPATAVSEGDAGTDDSSLLRLDGTITASPSMPSGPEPRVSDEPWERPVVWMGTVGMVGMIVGLVGLATRLQGSTGSTGATSPAGGSASGAAGLGALPIGPYAEPMMLWGLGLGFPLYLTGALMSARREDQERRRATGLPGDEQ